MGRGWAGPGAEPPAYLGPRGWPGEAQRQPLAHRLSASCPPFRRARAARRLDVGAVPLVCNPCDLRVSLGSSPKLASQGGTLTFRLLKKGLKPGDVAQWCPIYGSYVAGVSETV